MSCKCLMLNCHYFLFSPKSYCKFLCLHYFLLSAFQLWIQWAPWLSHSKSFNACSCTGTVIIKVLISIVLVFYKTCFWTNTKADQIFIMLLLKLAEPQVPLLWTPRGILRLITLIEWVLWYSLFIFICHCTALCIIALK